MVLFDKFFGKKEKVDNIQTDTANKTVQLQQGDTFISSGSSYGYKIIRPLTVRQREGMDKSTILLRSGQLYMHYWTDDLVSTDRDDPEWQNKVMFFWKAEEPFPKKSLPPVFEFFKVKHFLFTGDTSNISLLMGQAMPWFGMPGLGEKFVCEMNREKVVLRKSSGQKKSSLRNTEYPGLQGIFKKERLPIHLTGFVNRAYVIAGLKHVVVPKIVLRFTGRPFSFQQVTISES